MANIPEGGRLMYICLMVY